MQPLTLNRVDGCGMLCALVNMGSSCGLDQGLLDVQSADQMNGWSAAWTGADQCEMDLVNVDQ